LQVLWHSRQHMTTALGGGFLSYTKKYLQTAEGVDVKTSISKPESFITMVWAQNPEINYEKSVHAKKDSRDNQMRMHSSVLLHDPFYIRFLFSLLFHFDTDKLKSFRYHLQDDLNYIFSSLNEDHSCPSIFIIQIIIYIECLFQKSVKTNETDNFYLCPNFCVNYDDDSPEPESPSDTAQFLIKNCKTEEDVLILMKKLFLGIDPSKQDGEYCNWDGPIEELASWLTGCFFTNKLYVPIKKYKKPEDEEIERPIITSLIEHHIIITNNNGKTINKSTIFRNCRVVYHYFSNVRNDDISQFDISPKVELIKRIKQKEPNFYSIDDKPMKKGRHENIISGCNFIPE
ncbi:MAG: hypothetical protein FWF42_04155, partial [Streptococcaceae bacterium]|nr:hypothetical protein [Streptococcaceae bacterium]